ncbi:hypothetical protein [Winogradskyella alexanderae]|uniref:ATP synthase protein I n=1 Tax=Winogradskyella alexanderae TaxID=2877123 RepID=A0ABS7XP92_9FLAO|nr:hypothetical protein [Winogradskyella alexanderae]MCA0131324.1 hypothetical protein [Winogradskyella alexanderae]
MEEFKKRQTLFLLQLIAVTAVLFGIHSYLLHYFAKEVLFFFPVWQIYAFHVVITLLFYSIINYRYSSGKKEIFNLFMVLTFMKMFVAILFLLPLLLSDFENKQPDVFNFFIPYFLYLFFEVFTITRFLQKL